MVSTNNQRTSCSSCILSTLVLLSLVSLVISEKYKVCVVDGRGGFMRSGRYCPILDKPDSKVECVLALDRLDCLRRISKGTVDFSVFTPEDLVTARNSDIEVLITNQLRYIEREHEYEIVAIVRDSSGIQSKHDLKDKKFCHPGYGYEADWTRILSNYLEASVVPQLCEPALTITENRIKASSQFFKSACKAGPWVNNPQLDDELKRKYPNLCSLCDNPNRCSTSDKYWGRRGPLYCLTDGAGDISWARLDDVKPHFGLVSGESETSPEGYSYLCPDGTTKPLNHTSGACVWVVKPWPVIATKRTSAQEIQEFVKTLTHQDSLSWQSALLNLIETFHMSITNLRPPQAIETYLDHAPGFLNANSFSGCHPPRTIRICTTSILENVKCSWLRESSTVYGIEPDLECLKADNTTHCMQALNDNVADMVIVPGDLVSSAYNRYNLKTLFFETVNDDEKYLTVAVTKSKSSIDKIEDAKGYKACFPNYDGVAWNTIVHFLNNNSLISSCSLDQGISDFFGPSCVPNSSPSAILRENCDFKDGADDLAAIKCLLRDQGDIAFISQNSLVNFIHNPNLNKLNKYSMDDFKILCKSKSDGCHLSWATPGQAMVRSNSSDLWMKDTLDVFLQLDNLFGKNYKSLTTPLQLFGSFNGKPNVLFHDSTVRLKNVPFTRNFDTMKRPFEDVIKAGNRCIHSSGSRNLANLGIFLSFCIFIVGWY